MTKTLWFSYSLPPDRTLDSVEPFNSPYSLTWNLGRYLRDHAAALSYAFEYRNLDTPFADVIGPDDIVIGHPWWPTGWMSGALDSPARLKFIIQPYQQDIVGVNESWWIKEQVAKANWCFWVTGLYWWDTMATGLYGDWKAKSTRLDMACNTERHPRTKTRFNAPGKRRFLAIGADTPYKGLDMIADLFRQSGYHLGYYGNAAPERFAHVPRFTHYGGTTFTPEVTARVTTEYDAFVSLARGDANPTTLLETALWGLVPFCNELCGYWPNRPFMELRKGDTLFNLRQLDWLQTAPDYKLQRRADAIRVEVVAKHTWAIFCETVWAGIKTWL